MKIQGPPLPGNQQGIVGIDLPDCVVIHTPKDAEDFKAFVASIIQTARQAWEEERKLLK